MNQYTDEFVLKQYEYYKSNLARLGSGRNIMRGLYNDFLKEAESRNLIKFNEKTNQYEILSDGI